MTDAALKFLAVGIASGLGMLGPGLGLGLIGFSALTGISRNPEASGPILTNMILIGAFAEAIGIYVLIIAVMLGLVFK